MVSARDDGLQITKDCVDPFKTLHTGALAILAKSFTLMRMPSFFKGLETNQSVRHHRRFWNQRTLPPCFNFFVAECFNRRKYHIFWMPLHVGLDCGNERHLVFRASSSFAARVFTAQIGIINFYSDGQPRALFPCVHNVHKFLLYPPDSSVVNADHAHQLHTLNVVLVLGYRKHGLKPLNQWHFGRMEDRPTRQRSLSSTAAALECLYPAMSKNAVAFLLAVRALKALRPTHCFQGGFTLRFSPIAQQKIT